MKFFHPGAPFLVKGTYEIFRALHPEAPGLSRGALFSPWAQSFHPGAPFLAKGACNIRRALHRQVPELSRGALVPHDRNLAIQGRLCRAGGFYSFNFILGILNGAQNTSQGVWL